MDCALPLREESLPHFGQQDVERIIQAAKCLHDMPYLGRPPADHRPHHLRRERLSASGHRIRGDAKKQGLGVEHQTIQIKYDGADLHDRGLRARWLSGKSCSWSRPPSPSNGIVRKSVSKVEVGVSLDLVRQRWRDPKGRDLERVGDQNHTALVARDTPACVKTRRNHVAVVCQSERDAGTAEEVARQAIDPHRRRINAAHQALGREVGQADPQGIATGLDRQVEHGDSRDDRLRQIGHRLDALPADHVGVHPGPAIVLAKLAHDQHIDLVEGQPRHQRAGFVQEKGFCFEQLVGLDGDDPSLCVLARSPEWPGRARPEPDRAETRRLRGRVPAAPVSRACAPVPLLGVFRGQRSTS